MKKLLLAFLVAFGSFSIDATAQCTPDPDLSYTGFSPANLPPAYADAPYSQTLSFHATKDTTIFFNGSYYPVTIDSVILMSINGIPSGFSYQCLNRCVIQGGQTGCALLSGSTDSTMIGSYPITTYVMTYYHLTQVPTSTFNRIDSSSSFTFRIYRTTGVNEVLNKRGLVGIKAYPNPAQDYVRFDLSGMKANSQGTIMVYDALGRELAQTEFFNNSAYELNTAAFKTGMYKCKIVSENEVYYTSFIKE